MPNALSVHRQILKEAWGIAWRFKPLWLLGALASFWTTNNVVEAFLNPAFFSPLAAEQGDLWRKTPPLNGEASFMAIFGLVIGVAVVGFILWITTASRGGLIGAVDAAHRGTTYGIRKSLELGTRRFWSIFGISVGGKILWGALLLGIISLLSLAASSLDTLAQSLLFSAAFVLITLSALSLSFIINYALTFVILHRTTLWQGAVAATRLFFKNWLVSLELAVILYALGITLGFVILALLLVLAMPFVLLLMVAASLGQMLWFWILGIPAIIALTAAALVAGAAFTTFQFAAWILLFKRLMEGNILSKLVRVFHHPR